MRISKRACFGRRCKSNRYDFYLLDLICLCEVVLFTVASLVDLSFFPSFHSTNSDTLGGPIRNKIMSNVGLIDDGYMTAWGDWGSLKPKAFPTAFTLGPNPTEKDVDACMKSLSDSMRSNGMRPGIWLAPFAADKHSKITKAHPDWIICDNSGRPVSILPRIVLLSSFHPNMT